MLLLLHKTEILLTRIYLLQNLFACTTSFVAKGVCMYKLCYYAIV